MPWQFLHCRLGQTAISLLLVAAFVLPTSTHASPKATAPAVEPVPFLVDTVATACVRLAVRNDGNLGHLGEGKVNFDYWTSGECDTLDTIPGEAGVYLRSGGPFIAYQSGDSMIMNHTFGPPDNSAPNGFLPVTDLVAPIFSFGTFSGYGYQGFRSGQFVTRDSALALERVIYAPTSPDSCNFMIVMTRVFPYKPQTVTGVTISELVDWDVPSDTLNLNGADFDMNRHAIFQRGVELAAKDALECSGGGNDNHRRFGGVRMLSSCNWGSCGAWPEIALWVREMPTLMDNGVLQLTPVYQSTQMTSYDIPASPTQADWLIGANVLQSWTIPPKDTQYYGLIVASSYQGTQAQFLSIMDKAYGWFQNHVYSPCLACCCIQRGNADGDRAGVVDIADLQMFIDYLFFGGLPAACFDEFDVAGSDMAIDISDLQVIIDYLFFGGSLPSC